MKKTMILLANGYEEIEALTVVDFLRRAEISIDFVSIIGKLETVSAHGVHILADKLIEEINPNEYDAVITPGGLPGSNLLAENEKVNPYYNLSMEKQTDRLYLCLSTCLGSSWNRGKSKRYLLPRI